MADFDTVAMVTAGLNGKLWRGQVGGEWAVESYLVSRMCGTIKCRAADDLLYVCESYLSLDRARLDFTFEPIPDLFDRIVSKAALPERALTLWLSVGTYRCRFPVLRERRGEPRAVFDALCEIGYPDTVVEVCREGLKKCGEILAPHLTLLMNEYQRSARHAEPDDLPEEEMIGEVPCWAYDMHVREGNRAMARFLKTECETARWIVGHIQKRERGRFLGGMLFRVESGLVDRRLRWGVGDHRKV